MGLTVVSPPASLPVTLEQAKLQVNVTGSARDDLLTIYLEAATDAMEGFLGRSLIDQTWDLTLNALPDDDGAVELLRPPLIELVGVFYTDDAGDEQEVAASDYTLDLSGALPKVRLAGSSWPTARDIPGSARLRYRAGYLDQGVSPPVANVPPAIKAGILLYLGDLYAFRESFVAGDQAHALPDYIERMVRRYRVNLGMA